MRYTWEGLEWREAGKWKHASVTLFPDDELFIEEGWVVRGPIHVKFQASAKHTKAKYSPVAILDLDNPQEYPCKSCGAERHAPCVGNKPECVYRVFFTAGGML